jgi:threonine/homoserine/homoserine lactone efflux protein
MQEYLWERPHCVPPRWWGLSKVLFSHNWIWKAFHVGAGLYLVFLVYGMITSKIPSWENKPIVMVTSHCFPHLKEGYLIGVSHPKSMLADLAILANFIHASTSPSKK